MLSSGHWLDQLYCIKGITERLRSVSLNAKPSMALWGPSQSGKSTLLARYLDSSAGLSGVASALQWIDGEKVRFSSGEKVPKDWIVLNPYNLGSDATYCVSRFVLAESVLDNAHPVEIRLTTEEELLLFLAHGYHSECDRKVTVATATGEKVVLNSLEWDRRLKSLKTPGAPTGTSRLAYERLHSLTEVLDVLVFSHLERYENLESGWRKLWRSQLLQVSKLNMDCESVDAFASDILWDGLSDLTDPISQAYLELRKKLAEFSRRCGKRRIYCSYEAAKLLLNIDTFHRVTQTRTEADENTLRRRIQQMSIEVSSDAVKIGFGPGERLFASDDNCFSFALFQGIVRELVFPLRRDFLQKHSPLFCHFLETSDLLDFPGVARYTDNQNKLTKEALAGDGRSKLYTEILKRGKTAAIVAATARHPAIDGFSLLVNIRDFPSNTDQLTAGIRCWFEGLGKSWPPESRHLPINLVMTFCGQFINDVVQSGEAIGYDRAFGKIANLGILSEPKVAKYFLITYPEFDDRGGKINATQDQKNIACQQISASGDFRQRFGDNAGTLEAMVKDGGTDYLFRSLENQARQSSRKTLLASRSEGAIENLKALMNSACPAEVLASEQRKTEINTWIEGMKESVRKHRRADFNGDATVQVSGILRQFLNVPADILEAIPGQAVTSDLRSYVEKQFEKWRQDRLAKVKDLSEIGLSDHSIASRVLGYLCHYALDHGQIELWLRHEFRYVVTREEAKHARHFLALKMSETLVRGIAPQVEHRPFAGEGGSISDSEPAFIIPRLRAYARNEERIGVERDDLQSPHHLGFIQPFILHLETIKDMPGRTRPHQPGDSELRDLIEKTPR